MYQSNQSNLLPEEIAIIKAETRLAKFNFWFGINKAILIFISLMFSYYTLWYLTKPKTEGEMKAERVKIILEILKEKDPRDRAIAIKSVKKLYEELNPAFAEIDQSIEKTAKEDLSKLKKELIINLNRSTDETERRIIQTNIDEIDRLINLSENK